MDRIVSAQDNHYIIVDATTGRIVASDTIPMGTRYPAQEAFRVFANLLANPNNKLYVEVGGQK